MKITKRTPEEMGLYPFEMAKKAFEQGHRYLSWYGFTEKGELVEYMDEDYKYPALGMMYPSNKQFI